MVTYIDTFGDYETIFRTIGLLGVLLYVGGFFCLCTGALDSRSPAYFGLVLTAASCVLCSLAVDFNLSAALIQSFYIVMSLGGVLVRWRHLRRTQGKAPPAQTPPRGQDTMPMVAATALRQVS